ncbi:L-type lectin-domain containing receptor kinase IV.1 [Ananas comosus]|uniref:non-specific serine/threonine protein kinase n=1 Tax=Ananas comosus TaxID=4615 RepID=A0A199V736_ANACO|nr:L-type lectin-domain containing receptor kinase IV.1 [Ananas comosus]
MWQRAIDLLLCYKYVNFELLHSTQTLFLYKENRDRFPFFLFILLLLHFFLGKLVVSSPTEEEFTFNGFSGANLTLDGLATVSSDGLLILTNNTRQQKGHAFHPYPLRFPRNPSDGSTPSFSTTFAFAIVSEYADLSGHGIAFVITPSTNFSEALPSEYLGLFNMSSNSKATNHIVAVELDTILNSEFHDIDDNHVGIDINGLRSYKDNTAGYYTDDTGEFRNLTLISGKAMQVWVDYDGVDLKLNVTLSPVNAIGRSTTKPTKPLLSFPVNLSSVLFDLPVHVGFSSSTGSVLTSHYIIGWSFAMHAGQTQAPPLDYSKLPAIPRTNLKRHGRGSGHVVSCSFSIISAAGDCCRILGRKVAENVRGASRGLGSGVQAPPVLLQRPLPSHQGFGERSCWRRRLRRVYRGTLPNSGAEVAVKRVSHESRQGMREFVAEIVSIGRLRHRNIVQLLGYCRRKAELLLVYDFVPTYLHDGRAHKPALGWSQRFQIVKGVATGLLYLHEEWEQVVVHRDIKASNVLLDGEMNAKLGDFGLARLYDHGADLQTTHVVGTMGYLAPELSRTGRATTATDVFAFGVFLLEVVACGRRPVEQWTAGSQGEQCLLVDWVVENWRKGSILDTVDAGLGGKYAREEAEMVLKLGLMCSHPHPAARPSMRLVVQYMEGRPPLPELSPAYLSCTNLSLPHDDCFDDYVISYPSSMPSLHSCSSMLQKFSSFRFSLLLLLILRLVASSPTEKEFTFNGFSGANLSLDGIATVSSDGLLILTNTAEPHKSHAFHPSPLSFRRNLSDGSVPSFSTTFAFATVPTENSAIGGQGITFVITPSTDFSNALSAQYLGLFNTSNNGDAANHIVAVEIDTILNLELQDINDNHIGIDVNGLVSYRAHTAGYYADDTGEFRNLTLISGKAMQVWVDYDGADAKLNVTLSPINAIGTPTTKPTKPLMSSTVNLSAVLLDLPVHVGFSAATYPLMTSQYILGWSFAMNVGQAHAPPLNYSKLPAIPRMNLKGHSSRALGLGLAVASLVFVLLVTFVAFAAARWRSKYSELREDWEVEFGPHRFSYRDLFRATNGFRERELLGAGGFGKVYRGTLPTSRAEVAVKRVSHESRQGMREFVAEIASIGRLRHRNIVQLLGYCRRKGELLLVYDFIPNGSLDKYLHYGRAYKPALAWSQRLRIVKGVAAGLLYLHEEWEQVVVHRDIKASNVLLDGEMNARLGDFGLARLYDHGTDPQTTHVVGTTGYIAPELARTGRATTATDVFAFGVFILEVACGRRPVEQPTVSWQGEQFLLVDWVTENWRKGSILDTVDAGLEGEYVREEAEMVLKLGLICLHPHAAARPSMRLVVQYLEGRIPLPEPSPASLCFTKLSLPHNVGFDDYVVSYPSSVPSASTLSGGR